MTQLTEIDGMQVPLPDTNGRYFFKVEVGNLNPDGSVKRIMGRMEYPDMDYQNLVAIERVFVEAFLGKMVDTGDMLVKLMGNTPMSEFREVIEAHQAAK